MKTVNIMMGAIVMILLAGCNDYPRYVTDQQLRQELFFKCMQALPAGPQATKYNDWDEVVSECGTQAEWLAKRCVENCQ